MRVLLTGGGTGGHIYPALAVVERLRDDPVYGVEPNGMAWVGRERGMERDIVERYELPFLPISAGALRGRSPWAALRSLALLAVGVRQGMHLLRAWRADVVLATGGYVTAPLVIAAWLLRTPVLIYLPDMEPGLAVRVLSRLARRVAVTAEPVTRFFPPGKAVVTGYPVRRALLVVNKGEARRRLGLREGRPVVLILGGSSGAHSINLAVNRDLERLLALAQIVHISGAQDHDILQARRARLPDRLQSEYHLFAYLHEEMADALAAADLVVARAGAAVLGEFPALGLPSVLVPYPYAGQHQQLNASYLAEHGAAVVIQDSALPERFADTIAGLLADAPQLGRMAEAARALWTGDAAERLASLLASLAKGTGHE